ncbi:MAG: hypothetical protein ACTSUE_14055 [Promethearchaeota archaeon]
MSNGSGTLGQVSATCPVNIQMIRSWSHLDIILGHDHDCQMSKGTSFRCIWDSVEAEMRTGTWGI